LSLSFPAGLSEEAPTWLALLTRMLTTDLDGPGSARSNSSPLAVSAGQSDDRDRRGQPGSCYGSEGWGFESLRARPGQRPIAILQRPHCCQTACNDTSNSPAIAGPAGSAGRHPHRVNSSTPDDLPGPASRQPPSQLLEAGRPRSPAADRSSRQGSARRAGLRRTRRPGPCRERPDRA